MQHNSAHLKPFLKSVLKELPSEPFGVTIMQFTSEEAVIVMKREPHLTAVDILHFLEFCSKFIRLAIYSSH